MLLVESFITDLIIYRKWFQEKKFEKHLYELLRVKKWKEIKWLCMEQRNEFEYAKALY